MMRTRTRLIIAGVAFVAYFYLNWCHNVLRGVDLRRVPPRGFPHPDRWMLALADWFDARFPPPPSIPLPTGPIWWDALAYNGDAKVRSAMMVATVIVAFVAIAFSWSPFMRWRNRILRRHRGLCLECGYDLRGTLAAGRTQCPECGAATETQPGPKGPR